jgi:hypothetical protein
VKEAGNENKNNTDKVIRLKRSFVVAAAIYIIAPLRPEMLICNTLLCAVCH